MMKIKVTVSIGLVGCHKSHTIEVDDDETEDGLEEIARDEMLNMIEWDWERVEK